MKVTFLNPLYLFGMAAGLIPIIIHLMARRKEVVISLPTVRFVMEAQRRRSRRLKIRRWLLLLFRIFMVILLSLILARPVVVSREALIGGTRVSSSVIILDNSPSMGYRRGGRTLLDEARDLAGEFAEREVPTGEVSCMTTDEKDKAAVFTRDREHLSAYLKEVTLSTIPADLTFSLDAAYRLMQKASFGDRQIILITDMARPQWDGFNPELLDFPDLGIPIRVVDISGGAERWNTTIEDVAIIPGPGGDGSGLARVKLSSTGAPAKAVAVQLDLDGHLQARHMVELPGDGHQELEFALPRMKKGYHRLQVTTDADPLVFDNTFFAALEHGGSTRVLTVDGSPRASLAGSETFFLQAALVPDRYGQAKNIENLIIQPEQLSPDSLDELDVLILANIRSIKPAMARALSDWVGQGGGLMIFLGDNYQPGDYQESLDAGGADLLPVYLGEETAFAADRTFGYIAYDAPPLAIFKEPGSGDFSLVRSHRYVSLGAGGLKPGAGTLIAYDEKGEMPFLIERPVGKGRVLLFTSSADLDWNNFASQTAYLPLLQRSLEYLAGEKGIKALKRFTAGETAYLDVDEENDAGTLPVITPGGSRLEAPLSRTDSGARAQVSDTGEPGFYTFHSHGQEIPVQVNISREESDIRHVSAEDLSALARVFPIELIRADEAGLGGEEVRATTDPVSWLFAALLLLLIVEGLMSAGIRIRVTS